MELAWKKTSKVCVEFPVERKMQVAGVPAIKTPQAVMFWGQRRWQRSYQVSTLMWDLQVKVKCCREYRWWLPEGDRQPFELHWEGSRLQEAEKRASAEWYKWLWFCLCCSAEETGLNHLRLFNKNRVLLTAVKWSDSLRKHTKLKKAPSRTNEITKLKKASGKKQKLWESSRNKGNHFREQREKQAAAR